MKIRIGIGSVGLGPGDPGAEFDEFVDALERSGVDSLWLPDLVSSGGVDVLAGTAWAAARTRSLKVGTGVIVLPGRNPALLAAQLGSLAVLAPKRILPTFGVRAATEADRQFYPVTGVRAEVFEESMVLLRRLFTDRVVTFRVSGTRPGLLDMPTMWVHNLRNVGDEDLVTAFWSDQLLDPDHPDQYRMKVVEEG